MGWSLEYIGGLELPDLISLEEYWVEEPPPSVTLGWLVGYKPPERKEEKPLTAADIGAFGGKTRSFDKLPDFVQADMIKSSGLSEAEFFKLRKERLKRRYGR